MLEMAAGAAVNSREDVAATANTCPYWHHTNKASTQLTNRNNELLSNCCAVTGLAWRCALVLLVPTVSHHNTATQHKKVPVSQVPTGPPPTSEVRGQEGPSRNTQPQAPVHPTVMARTVRTLRRMRVVHPHKVPTTHHPHSTEPRPGSENVRL